MKESVQFCCRSQAQLHLPCFFTVAIFFPFSERGSLQLKDTLLLPQGMEKPSLVEPGDPSSLSESLVIVLFKFSTKIQNSTLVLIQ